MKPVQKRVSRKRNQPLVIEFAGLPSAGKTSAATYIDSQLRLRNIECCLIEDVASECRMDRYQNRWEFKAWTFTRLVSRFLECHTCDPAQVIIMDRGFFDTLCWIDWYRRANAEDKAALEILKTFERFVRVPAWFERTKLVFVFLVSIEAALGRRGQQPGQVTRKETFDTLTELYQQRIPWLKGHYQMDVDVRTTDDEPIDSLSDSVLKNVLRHLA